MPRGHFVSRTGFSLVELLTAVAIVAVLAGLLLPALASARRRMQDAACVSNLRQIGSAIGAYVADHDGYLPGPAYGNMPTTYSTTLCGPYVLSVYLAEYLGGPPEENTVPHTLSVLYCPAFPYRSLLPSAQWNLVKGYVPAYQLPNVLYNGMLPNPWGRPATAGLNMNTTPMRLVTVGTLLPLSKTWAVMDGDASNGSSPGVNPKPNHGSHWNRLYFDFHVAPTSTGTPIP